jgi:hypothetical protein
MGIRKIQTFVYLSLILDFVDVLSKGKRFLEQSAMNDLFGVLEF